MIDKENNTSLRNKVINFIQSHQKHIEINFNNYKLTKININNSHTQYALYYFKINGKDVGDGLIICVEKLPALLNKNERSSLENCINILKSRLIYE